MRYDVVTIVASRRGIPQLRELVSQLPSQFGVPIVCMAEADERLVTDLAATTKLTVKWAEAGETLRPGHVYVSPPGASIVMLDDRTISLTPFGAESTALRPVDAFLGSAGRVFGQRTLAVMLAGFYDDGAEGAYSLKRRGGSVLVLDRATAEYYGLGESLIRTGAYDRIITAGEVANALRASFTGRDLLENAELQIELGHLLESALRISGTPMGHIQLAEPLAGRLHVIAYRGLDCGFLDECGVVSVEEHSAWARAYRERRRTIVENVFDDAASFPYQEVARQCGFSALQSTPIARDDSACGVFSTLYAYPHKLSTHEARSFDEIAENARLLVEQVA